MTIKSITICVEKFDLKFLNHLLPIWKLSFEHYGKLLGNEVQTGFTLVYLITRFLLNPLDQFLFFFEFLGQIYRRGAFGVPDNRSEIGFSKF